MFDGSGFVRACTGVSHQGDAGYGADKFLAHIEKGDACLLCVKKFDEEFGPPEQKNPCETV
jgi:hypothetical protein